ncbi:MAG TPA: glycosyltransferase family 1 protein [Gammaproteobacteria bacterium]|nr:glycosyltransferase family 1 protein [Gammaproteobacteria bacterium]
MTNLPLHIVHTEASTGWGGQEIRILSEATGLRDRGHYVQLLCPGDAPIFEAARDMGLTATALDIGKKRIPGLLAMRNWLKNHPTVDILNTHSSTDSWLSAVACKTLSRPPIIVRTRHISTPISHDFSTRWLYTKASRHIVTTGEKLRRTLIEENRFPDEKITSVPTGVDPQIYRPGDKAAARKMLNLPVDTRIIGIVATLRGWKGHQYLLDAVKELNRPDILLLIVGDGPQGSNIELAVENLGITHQVRLVGNQKEVTPWLQTMDLLALPSWANEGVPQSILQAMMCALPVISTPVGSIEEAVINGETGIIIPKKDADALAAAIADLLDHPEHARALGEAGVKRAHELFSRKNMLDHMEEIFSALAMG